MERLGTTKISRRRDLNPLRHRRPADSAPKRAFLHEGEENGHENQHVNRRGNHAPTRDAAIGFITSEPIPVSHRMGTRLARTTLTVMTFGRNLWTASSIMASSMSSCRTGFPLASLRFKASWR